jgi:hypothetical protein
MHATTMWRTRSSVLYYYYYYYANINKIIEEYCIQFESIYYFYSREVDFAF